MKIEYVYWLCGALLLACAVRDLRQRRYAFGTFWAVTGACLLGGDAIQSALAAGDELPAQLAGVGVIVLALLAGSGRLRRGDEAPAHEGDAALIPSNTKPPGATTSSPTDVSPARGRNALFVPALVIPLGTVALILLQPWLQIGDFHLLDPRQVTLSALGLACVAAAAVALAVTRAAPLALVNEGARLLDSLSWAALLPMLLAMLGAVFAATGVGDAVAHGVAVVIPTDSRLACLIAYALGMAVFTLIMGNAFAAFPVMTAGVGLPLLVVQHHADPAALGALGMLAGYCATLLTPMAANFNVVPVALLQLRDPYAVIRAQLPTALVLFAANFLLLAICPFL